MPSLLLDPDEFAPSGTEGDEMTLRKLLDSYASLQSQPAEAQQAALAALPSIDDQMLLRYALSLDEKKAAPLRDLLDGIATRAAAGPLALEPAECTQLLAALGAAPAQVHPGVAARLGAARGALALAAGSLPIGLVAQAAPYLAPVLAAPTEGAAAEAAAALVDDETAVAALLPCYVALSLAARGALVCDLPPAPRAFAILAAVFAPAVGGGVALGPGVAAAVWRCVKQVAAEEWPGKEALEALHPQIGKLPPHEQRKLGEAIPAAAPLLESAPHMQLEPWIAMAETMNYGGRLVCSSRRVRSTLVRSEARAQLHWIAHNPEDRAVLGFFSGWFLFLISFFGVFSEILYAHPLELMFDIYILLLAALTCILEIKSTIVRDHLALPLERNLAFLRVASGRGCVYCVTGFLAFDTHERAQLLGGGIMLAVGAINLLLGGLTAPKLKRLRRAPADWAELRAKYITALEGAKSTAGLSAQEMGGLCAAVGVKFNRFELQALFLEMDRDRSGVVTEADLHCFYKGHIGRTLKRFAKRKNARRRTLRTWLCGSGASVLLTLPFWGMVVSVVMVPSAIAGMWYAVGQRSFLQLVINFYLTLFAILMVVVESRIDATRRLALHVHRYAQLLLYGAARGALFLLAALALLAQDTDWLCPLAYATELVGLAYIILGTRTVTRIRQLQRKLRTVAAVRASFRAVAHDQPSLQAFGLRLLGQSVNLPARWKVDTLALLDTLDLDRDGAVSEAELVYWLCDEASLGAEVTAAANDDDDDDSDVGAPTEVVVSPSAHATPAMSVAADQPQGTPATWQDLSV